MAYDPEALDDDIEQDPRAVLAETLRDFFVQALGQQEVIDGTDRRVRPAGSLYKTEDGWLKIHLQAPATDRLFFRQETNDRTGTTPEINALEVWALIPIPEIKDVDLIDLVRSSQVVALHVIEPGVETIEFQVRDDYFGLPTPTYESVDDITEYTPPSDEDQMGSAKVWVSSLHLYDLRTIEESRNTAA